MNTTIITLDDYPLYVATSPGYAVNKMEELVGDYDDAPYAMEMIPFLGDEDEVGDEMFVLRYEGTMLTVFSTRTLADAARDKLVYDEDDDYDVVAVATIP